MRDPHTPETAATEPEGLPPAERSTSAAASRHTQSARFSLRAALALALTVAVWLALAHHTPTAVALVPYDDPQPPGFSIQEVPDGWRVLSSGSGHLLLAAADDVGTDTASFEGRIVATLVTADSLPSTPDPQTFVTDGTQVLVYELLGTEHTPDGTLAAFAAVEDTGYLSVQLPPVLGWTAETAAQFAGGLSTTDAAETSLG